MKTISVDIDNIHGKKELVKFFEVSKFAKGDKIKLLTTKDENDSTWKIGILILIILIIISIYQKNKEEVFSDNVLKNIFDKYETEEELEKELEKELGINIAFVTKKNDPLDEAFGLWKNREISLESIRKKAWERTK